MGRDRARATVEEIAANVTSNLHVAYRWEGDALVFEHPDARGRIEVDETNVTVNVNLSGMLALFKGPVEKQIKGYMDQKMA